MYFRQGIVSTGSRFDGSIRGPFPAYTNKDTITFENKERFINVVNSVSGEVKLTFDMQSCKCVLRAGRSNYTFQFHNIKDAKDAVIEGDKVSLDKDKMQHGIELCNIVLAQKCAGAGIPPFVHYNAAKKRLEATDKRKLVYVNIDMGNETFIVSDEISRILSQSTPDGVVVTKDWVEFHCSESGVTIRALNQAKTFNAYPQFDKIEQAMESEYNSFTFPDEFATIYKRICFMAKPEDIATVEIVDNEMRVSGKSASYEFDETIQCPPANVKFSLTVGVLGQLALFGVENRHTNNILFCRNESFTYCSTTIAAPASKEEPKEPVKEEAKDDLAEPEEEESWD